MSLLVEKKDDVLFITLNRPEVRNAFDDALIREITEAFRSAEARVVVLSGAGKVFCAGGDLQWMQKTIDYSEEENLADAQALADMFLAVDECPCPVVARVHGAAFGGGLGLISACDIAIAEAGTRFCFSEVKLGLAPAVISPFAVRRIGYTHARRYFLTAEVFDAEEARRIGLISQVVPHEELDQAVHSVVSALLSAGPQAVREAKSLLRRTAHLPLREALPLCVQSIAKLRVSPEGQEGVKAFLQKRQPSWIPQGEPPPEGEKRV
ncbi:MAG: enoyl-CoA hydratase/isomerase family protein [Fimbriimonadales bacterium]|nr:enoyl-CoA hydratase/isomerase family protein [Fimbriimonadales bacterium]